VQGDELYAANQIGIRATKISIHKNGHIQVQLGAHKRIRLTKPLIIGNGHWLCPLQIRFLINPDSLSPHDQKIRKRHFLIETPLDCVLIMDLIVWRTGCADFAELPMELLPAGEPFWRTKLRSGRAALLVARMKDMDEEDRSAIRRFRKENTPVATLRVPAGGPAPNPYVEIKEVQWSPAGGNVLLVIPMGMESYHLENPI
jgi:hypothetical protein